MRDRYIVFHPDASDAILRPHPLLPDATKAMLDQWQDAKNAFGEELCIGLRMRIKKNELIGVKSEAICGGKAYLLLVRNMAENLSNEDLLIATEEGGKEALPYLLRVADETERTIQEGEEEIYAIEKRIAAAKKRQRIALECRDKVNAQ